MSLIGSQDTPEAVNFFDRTDNDDSTIASKRRLDYEKSEAFFTAAEPSVTTSRSTLTHSYNSIDPLSERYVAPESVRSSSDALREFEMNNLRFDRLGVYGRENEKKLLRSCVKKMTPDEDEPSIVSEIVLIGGESGCGKTTVSKCIAKSVKKARGLFVHGGFDLNVRGEPYSGIKAACSRICGELLFMKTSNRAKFSKLMKAMTEVMDAEMSLLVELIPDLHEVFYADGELSTEARDILSEESKIRLHEAFGRFLGLISKNLSPFVMVLDDLQRADKDSLELIQSVILNLNDVGFVLVGVYRSEEVDESHILTEFISGVKDVATKEPELLNVTEIELGNFSLESLKEIIKILLNMDEGEEILRLATICHKRTLGNMFHFDCFLRMLKQENLLRFNVGSLQWYWDEEAILSSTAATQNVVDLMRNRLLDLPQGIQRQLSAAACLGSSFEPEIVAIVWNRMGSDTSDDVDCLGLSEEHGILEMVGDKEYRWAHDKVQEAALSLLSQEELPSFRTRVGTILLTELSDTKRNTYLFAIVDLMNLGEEAVTEKSKLELAELNRQAAQKASEHVGLESMTHYANRGIQNLPDRPWERYYQVTLDLYSYAAIVESLLADKESLLLHVGKIFRQKDRPIMDKLRGYRALISYRTRDTSDPKSQAEALKLSLYVLSQFGCKFPTSKLGFLFVTVKDLLKVKKRVKSLVVGNVLEMDQMVDPIKLKVLEFLTKDFLLIYIAAQDMLALWILRSVELSLDHGICKYSSAAFAQLGVVFLMINDYKMAETCGNFAEKLMKAFNFKAISSLVAARLYGFSLAFSRPYHKLLPAVRDGHKDGLAAGDLNSSCTCLFFYVYMSLAAGTSLKTLEAVCRENVKKMVQLKNEQAQLNISFVWQAVLNLLGESDDPCEMQGEAIPNLEECESAMEGQTNLLRYMQIYLLAVFGEYEKGADMAIAFDGKFKKGGPGICQNMHETFSRGLCLFGMARKSKLSKYKKAAKKVFNTIKAWASKENPNVLHYEKLFEAEMCALEGKFDAAVGLYQRALVIASRSGFIQDSAIINERCADFLRNVEKSPEEAIYKMEEACKLYKAWGCDTKAQMLRQEYGSLLVKPSEVSFRLRKSICRFESEEFVSNFFE